MNILYISSKKRWGGVASWMQKTALALNKRGHQVHIVSHPNSKFNEVSKKDLNISPLKLGMEYNPAVILYIVQFIKKNRIDLVVTNLEKEVGIGGIAARLSKIPNIRRIGREDDFNNRFKNKWNHKHLVTKSIVPCNYITKKVVKRAPWLNTDNFTTIYNGRDPEEIDTSDITSLRRSWGITANNFVIGSTSQLLNVKKIDQLIIVFSRLRRKYNFLRLVISGAGKESDNLKELTVKTGINDYVVFPGFTKTPIQTSAAYDIAVLNSSLEGFPNTIVEYFASGRPVVSTDVGGVNEIIKDGFNGSLLKIGDEDALYNKLEILINSKDLREKYSQNAIATLSSRFSEKMMIDQLEDFFMKTISG